MQSNTHHNIDKPKISSDRSFGLVFCGFFLIVALFPLLYGLQVRLWAIAISFLLGAISILIPAVLAPFNRLWAKFGELLHIIISPITLGVLFFLVVTPTALLLRIFGKDPLLLRYDKNATTYWVIRKDPGPKSETFINQF